MELIANSLKVVASPDVVTGDLMMGGGRVGGTMDKEYGKIYDLRGMSLVVCVPPTATTLSAMAMPPRMRLLNTQGGHGLGQGHAGVGIVDDLAALSIYHPGYGVVPRGITHGGPSRRMLRDQSDFIIRMDKALAHARLGIVTSYDLFRWNDQTRRKLQQSCCSIGCNC